MTKIHAQSVQGMVDAAGGVVLTGGGVALTSVQLAKFVALVAEYAITQQHEHRPEAVPDSKTPND